MRTAATYVICAAVLLTLNETLIGLGAAAQRGMPDIAPRVMWIVTRTQG